MASVDPNLEKRIDFDYVKRVPKLQLLEANRAQPAKNSRLGTMENPKFGSPDII